MAPRFESFFKETAAGLRRNGVVAFAAMSTSFIALFLFGLSLLIAREFNLVTSALTGNVEVQVYLTDPVNTGTVARLTDTLQEVPAVAHVDYWNKERSCQQFEILFENQPTLLENVDCMEVIPTSFRVKLDDVAQFRQITAALGCTRDHRARRGRNTRSARSPGSAASPTTRSSSIDSTPSRGCSHSACSGSR